MDVVGWFFYKGCDIFMQTWLSKQGILLIALAAISWGTVGVVVKSLYENTGLSPISVGFYRLALSVPALLLALSGLGKKAFQIKAKDVPVIALMGLMLAVYQLCYFAAIPRVGVAIATLVTLCTAPILVALLSVVFLKERLEPKVIAALVIAVVGTFLLVGFQSASGSQVVSGVLLALGSATGYALVALTSRRLSTYHPLQPVAFGFTVGAVVLLPFALADGLATSLDVSSWLRLLYLGLIPTALAYTLFTLGMRTTKATVATIVTLLEPLTAVILAFVLFREQLNATAIVGGVLLIVAIILLAKKQDSKS
jgi:drug/metabolite transporter, DME family